MNHEEAIKQLFTERYLMNELAPEARDAFEEHLFGCQRCALDVRAGAAFVDEAKLQLPRLISASPSRPAGTRGEIERNGWFLWLRPVFVVPAFAAMLLFTGYQNFVAFPALRASANEPRLVPVVRVHGATRGSTHVAVTADRRHGVSLPLDLAAEPGMGIFSSYTVELRDAHQKLTWSGTTDVPADGSELQRSLEIPGAALVNGAYSVSIFGVAAQGERTAIETYVFDMHLTD